MVSFDANATEEKKEYTTLPTATYTMKPVDATVAWRAVYEDRNLPEDQQRKELDLLVDWQVSTLTPEQEAAGIALGEGVRQYIKVIFDTEDEYEARNGNCKFTNKFRDFVKLLSDQGHIPATYQAANAVEVARQVAEALNKAQPVQSVLVKEYTGEKGGLRNKVDTVSPPLTVRRRPATPTQPPRRTAVATPAPQTDDDELGW